MCNTPSRTTRTALNELASNTESYTAFRCACIATGLTPSEAERLWHGDDSVLEETQVTAHVSGDDFELRTTDNEWMRTDTPVRIRQ